MLNISIQDVMDRTLCCISIKQQQQENSRVTTQALNAKKYFINFPLKVGNVTVGI